MDRLNVAIEQTVRPSGMGSRTGTSVQLSFEMTVDIATQGAGAGSIRVSVASPGFMDSLMPGYHPRVIEPRWQQFWAEQQTFRTPDLAPRPGGQKFYILDMFPYPS